VSAFEEELERRLARIREAGLWRELRRIDSPQGARVRFAGRELVNLSSNDYLGLAAHPALIEAAAQALRDFGAGAGASRLICGSLAPHHRLEESLAAFKGTEAALSFSSGYAAAVGTITALLDKDAQQLVTVRFVLTVAASCVVEQEAPAAAALMKAAVSMETFKESLSQLDSKDRSRIEALVRQAVHAPAGSPRQENKAITLKLQF
jgi:hypothetical protein